MADFPNHDDPQVANAIQFWLGQGNEQMARYVWAANTPGAATTAAPPPVTQAQATAAGLPSPSAIGAATAPAPAAPPAPAALDPQVQDAITFWNQQGNPAMAAYVTAANTGGDTSGGPPPISQAQAAAAGLPNPVAIGAPTLGPDGTSTAAPPAASGGAAPGQPSPPAATTPEGTPALSPEERDARAIVANLLGQYGLGSLTDWAWQQISQGATPTEITLLLRQRPEFAARFPGIINREKSGLPPISPGDYVALEDQYTQMLNQAGLAPFVDRNQLTTNWISGDTSPAEAHARIQEVQQVVYQEPPEVRAELQRMFGVQNSVGAATAYYLDPNQALPKIQQQLLAAEIGGASDRTGYGLLTADEATRLAGLGVTADTAQQGFGQLQQLQPLFQQLPGEAPGGISREEQLAAQFEGNAGAQQDITTQRQRRLAQFAGGGSFAAGQQGVAGIGQVGSA